MLGSLAHPKKLPGHPRNSGVQKVREEKVCDQFGPLTLSVRCLLGCCVFFYVWLVDPFGCPRRCSALRTLKGNNHLHNWVSVFPPAGFLVVEVLTNVFISQLSSTLLLGGSGGCLVGIYL